MYIAILGRQPAIGMAELERVFEDVSWFSDQSALVNSHNFNIERLGGSLKAGRVVARIPHGDWRQTSTKIVQTYTKTWAHVDSKITLGISAYGFDVSPREVQKTGIILKNKLKANGISLRLIPNAEPALNTATSHHNKLGLASNKVELLVVRARSGAVTIAESTGAQNITALARRDQERPKRDAFVGMLPPKLAQIMINLATPLSGHPSNLTSTDLTPSAPSGATREDEGMVASGGDQATTLRILDPFCGTGVILQEAMLMGYSVYGTDLSEKMIDYTQANLTWLMNAFNVTADINLHVGDAMNTKWRQPIDAVAAEGYLGQPFSAPPSPTKLAEVRDNCNHIMSEFLKNISAQIKSGTPLCIAVPAWRSTNGNLTHLPLTNKLDQLGFNQVQFKNVRTNELLYYREDQVVARELLVLVKS